MSYKVLIVDDEAFIRIGMKMSIEWEKNGFELIGEASNGITALSLISQNVPDIVITDIKMPEMDGIELIKAVKAKHPYIACIVLSNYDEFNLVRDALINGAEDFCLKLTANNDRIIEVLVNISKNIERRRKEKKDIIEVRCQLNEKKTVIRSAFFQDIIKGSASEKFAIKEIIDMGLNITSCSGFILYIKILNYEYVLNTRFDSDEDLLSSTIINLLDEIINQVSCGIAFEYKSGGYAVVAAGDDKYEVEISKAAQIRSALSDYLDIEIIYASNLHYQNYAELKKCLIELENVKWIGFYDMKDSLVIQYKSNYFFEEGVICLYLEMKKKLDFSQCLSLEKAKQDTVRFLEELKDLNVHPNLLIKQTIMLLNFIRDQVISKMMQSTLSKNMDKMFQLFFLETLDSSDSFISLKNKCLSYLDNLDQELHKQSVHQTRNDVMTVVDFIKQNYNKKITLRDLALIINMNESYFCRLFRKEIGKNIQEFIEDVRIEKACEMIKTTEFGIAEIAESVGYVETSYFNRIFKKRFFMSPSQYKRESKNITRKK